METAVALFVGIVAGIPLLAVLGYVLAILLIGIAAPFVAAGRAVYDHMEHRRATAAPVAPVRISVPGRVAHHRAA